MKKRTLYDCYHARVNGERIYCAKGYVLSAKSGSGHIDIGRLARGEPLGLAVCKKCPNFDVMGPPLPPEERGWIKRRKAK